MKRGIILGLLLPALAILVPSCVITSHDYHVEISCDTFMENPKSLLNDFQMEIGDKLYVKLCSNPTTGFEWSYEMSGDAAIKEEDHDFEEPGSDLPGAAGQETWTFEAIAAGKTIINMEYSQPWEGGLKGEWTYKIDITVE
jgi:inhibitor of cysteine peptidase